MALNNHLLLQPCLSRKANSPAPAASGLVFGGRDMRDLYVVTADNTDDPARKGTIFRTRADVPGLAVPRANF